MSSARLSVRPSVCPRRLGTMITSVILVIEIILVIVTVRAGKNLGFLEKVFRFIGFF